LLNRVNFVPRKIELPRDGALTRHLQPHDRPAFEERGEATPFLGPRQADNLHAVLLTVAARRLRVQNRLILEDVEVAPAPLRLVVVELATPSTLRARPCYTAAVTNGDMDLTLLKPKVDVLDLPRRNDPEQIAKHLPIVHA
jgi:hypothetical protein